MSGYAAIVRRDTFGTPRSSQVGPKRSWFPRSADGRECYVSVSEDRVSVISFDEGREVARVTVGDHPQRVRTGFMYLSSSALTAATSRLVDRDGDHRRP